MLSLQHLASSAGERTDFGVWSTATSTTHTVGFMVCLSVCASSSKQCGRHTTKDIGPRRGEQRSELAIILDMEEEGRALLKLLSTSYCLIHKLRRCVCVVPDPRYSIFHEFRPLPDIKIIVQPERLHPWLSRWILHCRHCHLRHLGLVVSSVQ